MTPRTSFLMPQNDGFKRLGLLVSNHLLQASSKSDLENVILHHVLDTVEYSSSFINGSHHSYASLEGSDVRVERLKNGTVTISSSGGWEGIGARVTPGLLVLSRAEAGHSFLRHRLIFSR